MLSYCYIWLCRHKSCPVANLAVWICVALLPVSCADTSVALLTHSCADTSCPIVTFGCEDTCCPIATHRFTDTSVDLMPYSAVETQVLSYCHTCMCRHKCSLIATQLCRHVLPCCHAWLYRHKCCPIATHPCWHKCYPIVTFGCANTSIVLIFFKNLVIFVLQLPWDMCLGVCVSVHLNLYCLNIYIHMCKWICQRLGSSQVRCTKCPLSLLLPRCLCR